MTLDQWRAIKSPDWKTSPISPTCEVLVGKGNQFCGKPTVAAYPASGGGWMPLCVLHARKHLNHGGAFLTDELIAKGETWA